MKTFTAEEFQEDFDNLMERVEQGESFLITDGDKNVKILPYKEYQELNDLLRIYTDHDEAC
jgi:prevent-host-death family protein